MILLQIFTIYLSNIRITFFVIYLKPNVCRQFHQQDITGVGLTTGTTYRGTGGTIIIGQQEDQHTHTYVNNFNIIATEPAGISSIEYQVLHIISDHSDNTRMVAIPTPARHNHPNIGCVQIREKY